MNEESRKAGIEDLLFLPEIPAFLIPKKDS